MAAPSDWMTGTSMNGPVATDGRLHNGLRDIAASSQYDVRTSIGACDANSQCFRAQGKLGGGD
jgi:hypothetical protein